MAPDPGTVYVHGSLGFALPAVRPGLRLVRTPTRYFAGRTMTSIVKRVFTTGAPVSRFFHAVSVT